MTGNLNNIKKSFNLELKTICYLLLAIIFFHKIVRLTCFYESQYSNFTHKIEGQYFASFTQVY